MFCKNCGNKIAEGASFCGACGSAAAGDGVNAGDGANADGVGSAAAGRGAAPAYGDAPVSNPQPASQYASQPASQYASQPASQYASQTASQYASQPATQYTSQPAMQQAQGNLTGFSPKISDPAFEAYKKKSRAWSFIFTGVLFIIAVIAFPIYGNKSGDIDWPQSLYYGLGIGGMFILIAALQTLKRSMDKTWDGEVIYKDCYRLKQRSRSGHVTYTDYYILKIKMDSGKIKKHKWRSVPGVYHYLEVGDRVRHHKGFLYYEKFDKTGDEKIMCAACNSFVDISKERCPRCKCPLLK